MPSSSASSVSSNSFLPISSSESTSSSSSSSATSSSSSLAQTSSPAQPRGNIVISSNTTNAALFDVTTTAPLDIEELIEGDGNSNAGGGVPSNLGNPTTANNNNQTNAPHGGLDGPDGTNRFGLVRDRLFHVMVVKLALGYNRRISYTGRRLIEASVLAAALFSLALLVYVHVVVSQMPATCLLHVRDEWPRKGILRVEVIRNVDGAQSPLHAMWVAQRQWQKQETKKNPPSTPFDLKKILKHGPRELPPELRSPSPPPPTTLQPPRRLEQPPLSPAGAEGMLPPNVGGPPLPSYAPSVSGFRWLARWVLALLPQPLDFVSVDFFSSSSSSDVQESGSFDGEQDPAESASSNPQQPPNLSSNHQQEHKEENTSPAVSSPAHPTPVLYVYVLEYSLHHGLLRLSQSMRDELSIPQMLVRLDADAEECFGDWKNRLLMHHVIGYEDVVIASVRQLAAENEAEKGYLRDLISGDFYHFVTVGISRTSYFTALVVMVIFTFSISMLLRFSHHQIFLFIVELLHTFEMAHPIVFPVAPLITVILALVGMETIMSEVFKDTSTAFYVILLVWMADQYEAICCHSPTGKRYWLRFFFLYHYAFYAYQYKYNGQFGGLALTSSTLFILHSMVFFFHHYEMPLIVYQERLQHTIIELQHNPNFIPPTATSTQAQVILRMPPAPPQASAEEQRPQARHNGDGNENGGGLAGAATGLSSGTHHQMRAGALLERLGTELAAEIVESALAELRLSRAAGE